VNSRKIANMFGKTILLGGTVGFIMSFFVNWSDYAAVLSPFDGMELIGLLLFFIGLALVFTVISQTGFFAYLFIHRFGQGFFKSFWPTVQVLVILFAIFDLIYFSYRAGKGEVSLLFYIVMTAIIVLAALLVARIKVQQTNRSSFIPAVFFMVVITALELSLVLRTSDVAYISLMVAPVLVANGYQLVALHEVTKRDEAHEKRIQARRKERLKRHKEKLAQKEKQEKKDEGNEADKRSQKMQRKENETKKKANKAT